MKYRTIVADPPWPYHDGPMGFQRDRGLDFLPYTSMDVPLIASLPVADIADLAAHVYVWTTNRFLWTMPSISDAWGFKITQVLTWCKAPMGVGPGSAFSNTTEFVVFGRMRLGQTITDARVASGLGRGDLHRLLFDSKPTGLVYRWEQDDCLPTPTHWDALRGALRMLGNAPDITADPQRQSSSWFNWKRSEHSAKPEAFIDTVEQVSPPPYVELFSRRHRLGWDVWGNESANTAHLEAAV
jgi:N6-adenosine-specific RNA methylase IME4